MKALLIAGLIFFCSAPQGFAMPVERQTAAGAYIKVYSRRAPRDFIMKVAAEADALFLAITKRMGVRDLSQWTGDRRINIYISDDRGRYEKDTGEPGWSDGASIQKARAIYSYAGAKTFMDTVLPHEMGHIIFRQVIGFENKGVPPWMEEGVSALQENKDDSRLRAAVKDARSRGALISLHELSRMDIRAIQDNARIDLFYAQAYCMVKYLTGTFGWEKFLSVCRAMAGAKDPDAALSEGFGFRTPGELENEWQRNI
jgi:hypothetical protein